MSFLDDVKENIKTLSEKIGATVRDVKDAVLGEPAAQPELVPVPVQKTEQHSPVTDVFLSNKIRAVGLSALMAFGGNALSSCAPPASCNLTKSINVKAANKGWSAEKAQKKKAQARMRMNRN